MIDFNKIIIKNTETELNNNFEIVLSVHINDLIYEMVENKNILELIVYEHIERCNDHKNKVKLISIIQNIKENVNDYYENLVKGTLNQIFSKYIDLTGIYTNTNLLSDKNKKAIELVHCETITYLIFMNYHGYKKEDIDIMVDNFNEFLNYKP